MHFRKIRPLTMTSPHVTAKIFQPKDANTHGCLTQTLWDRSSAPQLVSPIGIHILDSTTSRPQGHHVPSGIFFWLKGSGRAYLIQRSTKSCEETVALGESREGSITVKRGPSPLQGADPPGGSSNLPASHHHLQKIDVDCRSSGSVLKSPASPSVPVATAEPIGLTVGAWTSGCGQDKKTHPIGAVFIF